MVEGWFAFFNAASGNDLQRQLSLPHAGGVFALARAAAGLLAEDLISPFGGQRGRRRDEARRGAVRAARVRHLRFQLGQIPRRIRVVFLPGRWSRDGTCERVRWSWTPGGNQ